MKVSKIKIRNLYGIKEFEADGKSIELIGKTGAGKTSVLDSIRYALQNASTRPKILKSGEDEGEIIIETDTGLTINRKVRTGKTDYKSIKENGQEVRSPEAFLREIFTPLQLQPVEFMAMSEKEQNALILSMIRFDWDMSWIKEQFGEIPPDVDYSQNILSVLNEIQSEHGYYFTHRQDINRDIRNKRAFVEEIADTIPAGYDVDKWENENLSELYREIETIRKENAQIEKAKSVIENRDSKVRGIDADKEVKLAALDREMSAERTRTEKDIERLKGELKAAEQRLCNLEDKRASKAAVIEAEYKESVARYDAMVEEYAEAATKEVMDVSDLMEKAEYAEDMKGHINEYRRMEALMEQVDELSDESAELTRKIELARMLPGIILETAEVPVDGLTVKEGVPLINGLPIGNLSDGEKLDLCIEIATQNPNALKIILIDGLEKMSKEHRERIYQRLREKGVQCVSTRTTDDEDLTVIEL